MSDESVPSVTPKELDGLLRAREPVTVLDVRDRDEFERWHVDGPAVEAVQAPHAKFITARITGGVAGYAADLGIDASDHVVVVCGRGEASRDVAGMLNEAGLDAANLADGMAGWAKLFLAAPVPGPDDGPTVVQYRRPSSGCLSYLVVDGRRAAAVDPLKLFAGTYAGDAVALGADLSVAVDTHVHADHVSGVVELAGETGATPTVPAGAVDRGLDLPVEPRLLASGETVTVDATTLTAVGLPGHTSEMLGLRLEREGAGDLVFCGDSAFAASVARPDLEAGAEGASALAERLYDTVQELLALPEDTVLLPGHYANPSEVVEDRVSLTVADLRDRELSALGREAFVARVGGSMPDRPANYERIIEVNLGRTAVDDGEAFELELGPNSCAAN